MVAKLSCAREKERRKHTRYKIENAVIISPEGIYQIVDISGGGFSFKCNPHISIPESWVSDLINSIVALDEVIVKKIWVSLYESSQYNFPSLMLVGAKFNKLKEDQKLKLEKILQNVSENRK